MINHYHTLGVPENATPEQIKAAFKKLAVLYHPDKNQGDFAMEERFKEINDAYQILSDPYKKAQFDHQLNYLRFTIAQRQSASYREYDMPRYGQRPRPFSRPISREENNKATLYAFALTFAIALLVMLVRSGYNFYQDSKLEAERQARLARFDSAQSAYASNDIKLSLEILADMSPFLEGEDHFRLFQSEVLEDVIFKGEEEYLSRDFENAVKYYELVERFSPYRPAAMRAHLAQSYRYTNKPQQSLAVLKGLIEENYQVVATLIQMADVYRTELKDYSESKKYLELARDLAVNEYKRRFGNGYAIFITQEFIPYDHYYIYRDLALTYNDLKEYESAIGSTNWMKRIWKDSIESYSLAAISYQNLNRHKEACTDFNQARALGLSEPLPLFCR